MYKISSNINLASKIPQSHRADIKKATDLIKKHVGKYKENKY